MVEINCSYTSEIVCPYCGYMHRDSWDMWPNDREENDIYCHHCDRDFTVSRDVSITYTSYKMKGGDDE